MPSFSRDNKRIAKNTIIIYGRLLLTTLIGLLTSRFVLLALGVSDFGLYSVVGGIIGFLGFINGAMSMTTTRFINYEMGKTDGDPNKIFNICLSLHIVLSLFMLLLAETVGIYYVNNYLNVAPGKEGDAMFVFQVCTVVSCIGIINVPYSSLLLAFEKFGIDAAINICSKLLVLFFAVFLLYYNGNDLRLYALLMSTITFLSFFIYHYIGYKRWKEIVHFRWINKWDEYKEVLFFNNYNLLSSISIIFRSQGSKMLINYFFGTLVNAAFAVAYTVQEYVITISDNIDRAASPQIIQNIGKGDNERSGSLVNNIGKITILIMELFYFPLSLEVDTLLQLWLHDVPEGSSIFCQYTLAIALVAATASGMGQVINASGKIKWFKIQMVLLYVLVIPIAYLLFKKGCPPYTILLLFIISDLLSRVNQLILMRVILKYDVMTFIKFAYLPPLKVFVVMSVYCYLYNQFVIKGVCYHVFGFFFTLIVTFAVILLFALNKNERTVLIRFVNKQIYSK